METPNAGEDPQAPNAAARHNRQRHLRMRSLFLRGIGLVYLSAFVSLAVQVDGLIGSQGILPASELLTHVQRIAGNSRYERVPTLLWLHSSDTALHVLCWGGAVLSALLVAGVLPGPCAAILWLFYLSLTVVGQEFLAYQWDVLLLEAGLLAILFAPWSLFVHRVSTEPSRVVVWLIRWLVFRLMFLSGVVKLASGDPTWRTWQALRYHYETQPLPTWTSWYAHQWPPWFQSASVGLMFWAELIAPFLILGPRVCRWIAWVSLVGLQVLIAATGNYGAFNLLSIVLCLAILDDRDLPRWPPVPSDPIAESTFRRVVVAIAAAVILLLTAMGTAEALDPNIRFPSALERLRTWAASFRSLNNYGLFAVMTTDRLEIEVEGSRDGETWKPYRFRWKPCEPERRPRFTTPHMPRLDWQMWFAALEGDCRATPWFLRFEERLLEGSPAVLGLLRENPFPDAPPRFLRARLLRYHFTSWGERAWWRIADAGWFCPPIRRGSP